MRGTFAERACPTRGCGRPLRLNRFALIGVSGRCERCRQRVKRQGHVDQRPVRKLEVQKAVKSLKRLVKRAKKQEQVESALRQLAGNLADCTIDDLTQPAPNGRDNKPWVNRWQLAALHEVQRVMGDVDPVQSGYVVCAMFVMAQTERPPRFLTDLAARVQLVRMFRMQTALGCGSWYNETEDRVRVWYKTLPPRVSEYIAEMLTLTYASTVPFFLALIKKEKDRHRPLLLPE